MIGFVANRMAAWPQEHANLSAAAVAVNQGGTASYAPNEQEQEQMLARTADWCASLLDSGSDFEGVYDFVKAARVKCLVRYLLASRGEVLFQPQLDAQYFGLRLNEERLARGEFLRTAEVLGRLSMSTDEDDIVGFLSELAGFARPLTVGARLITRHDWGPDIGLDYPQPAEWSAIPYSRGSERVGLCLTLKA